MMMSHRYELNQQSIQSFERICGEEVDLEQAQFHADRRTQKHRIVVASVQTLNVRKRGRYRFEKFEPNDFGLLMIDEAHYSAAASYRRVVEHFQQNPDLKLFGVTATPDRLDGVGLGCLYDDVVGNLDINWGIKNGWLVAPRQVIVQLEKLDLSQVHTLGGDLKADELAKVVEMEENLHGMAKPIVDFAGTERQTIVFTASVPQAHRLAELIRDYHNRQHGTPGRVASLDGKTSPQDPRRKAVVEQYKNGEIQYFVNCGIACEGFDAPATSLIAIGRPTKSRARYTQMLGRSTRPLPNVVEGLSSAEERLAAIAASAKPGAIVLDFVGQSGRHSLVCAGSILAGEEPPEIVEAANRISSAKNFSGSTLDAIRLAKEERARIEEARRKKVTVGVKYRTIDTAHESYDLSEVGFRSKSYYRVPVTDKQRGFLLKLGYTGPQIDMMNRYMVTEAIAYAKANPRNGFTRWLVQQEAKNKF